MLRINTQLSTLFVFGLAIVSGLASAFYLRSTPFRAEHWALLQQMEMAPSLLEEMRRIAFFVCYSVGRYQPLAFFPTAISYHLFGFFYFGHYLLSILVHLAVSYQFVVLYSKFIGERVVGWRNTLKDHGLEILLFFVLFVSADILSWTFYLYIELALFFALRGISAHWNNKNTVAFYSLALATLLYEPFLVACGIVTLLLTMRAIREKKGTIPLVGFVFFIGIMLWAYSGSYRPNKTSLEQVLGGILGQTLYTRHDAFIGVKGAEIHPLFVFYAWILMLWVSLCQFFLPAFAVKLNIYESVVPELFRGPRFFWIAWASFFLLLFFIRYLQKHYSREKLLTVIALLFGIFGIIAWGRNEDGIFPAVQLRYQYIVSPFLCILILSGLRRLGKYYGIALLMLIAINAGSSWDHFSRVKFDMNEIAKYLEEKSSNSKNSRISAMVKGLREIQIPYRSDNLFFTYNARGAIR